MQNRLHCLEIDLAWEQEIDRQRCRETWTVLESTIVLELITVQELIIAPALITVPAWGAPIAPPLCPEM